jgi:hypothetical protein
MEDEEEPKEKMAAFLSKEGNSGGKERRRIVRFLLFVFLISILVFDIM